MGEGEGAKDVSDQIEDEDQLLGARQKDAPEEEKVQYYPCSIEDLSLSLHPEARVSCHSNLAMPSRHAGNVTCKRKSFCGRCLDTSIINVKLFHVLERRTKKIDASKHLLLCTCLWSAIYPPNIWLYVSGLHDP